MRKKKRNISRPLVMKLMTGVLCFVLELNHRANIKCMETNSRKYSRNVSGEYWQENTQDKNLSLDDTSSLNPWL